MAELSKGATSWQTLEKRFLKQKKTTLRLKDFPQESQHCARRLFCAIQTHQQ